MTVFRDGGSEKTRQPTLEAEKCLATSLDGDA